MYGLICKEGESEWWIRRKIKGKSEIKITKESKYRVESFDLHYVLSHHCQCPREVKEIARKLMRQLEHTG